MLSWQSIGFTCATCTQKNRFNICPPVVSQCWVCAFPERKDHPGARPVEEAVLSHQRRCDCGQLLWPLLGCGNSVQGGNGAICASRSEQCSMIHHQMIPFYKSVYAIFYLYMLTTHTLPLCYISEETTRAVLCFQGWFNILEVRPSTGHSNL